MMTIFRKIGLLAMTLTVLSCNSWLEVDPKTDVPEEDMYKNTKGFYAVLNGIYYNMGEPELYGRHLSWGAVEAWAKVYKLNESTDDHKGFMAICDFNYETKEVKSYSSAIWENGYRAIARANNLIEHIGERDSLFFDNGQIEKNVLMGEALALRAFMHFDLLRVYAQAPGLEMNGAYIPYVTKYPNTFNPPLPTNEVLENVIKDLKASKDLLATYDLLPRNLPYLTDVNMRLATTIMPDFGKFYAFRGTRLNYYAVTGLLARVYLYAGQHELALAQALEIIQLLEEGTFKLTKGTEILGDPKMMDDVLFCLNYDKMAEGYDNFSNGERNTLYVEDPLLFPVDKSHKDYDSRMDLLDHDIVVKYMEKRGKQAYLKYIPLLRLSEICYIAGECYMQADDMKNAVAMLDLVREARGGNKLDETIMPDVFMDKLVNDARKDLIGEGQILFMFKRLNKMYFSGESKVDPKGKQVLPKPTSESAM